MVRRMLSASGTRSDSALSPEGKREATPENGDILYVISREDVGGNQGRRAKQHRRGHRRRNRRAAFRDARHERATRLRDFFARLKANQHSARADGASLSQGRAFQPSPRTRKDLLFLKNNQPTNTMTTLIIICLALWLAKGAAQVFIGILQILAGLCCGLIGTLLWSLAIALQALENLWQTAFPENRSL